MAAILVVDDEPGVRELVRDALAEGGHRVDEAADAAHALVRLEERPYGAMVLDLRMPGVLDGMDVLTAARARWPEMAVLVMTAHGGVPEAVAALKLGAFDFFQKPLRGPDELRANVRRALAWSPESRAAAAAPVPPAAPPSGSVGRLLWELRRRRVYRVAVGYAAAAFVGLQGAELVLPALPVPAWSYTALVATAVIGFPVAAVLGWIYDIEATGLHRTRSVDPHAPEKR